MEITITYKSLGTIAGAPRYLPADLATDHTAARDYVAAALALYTGAGLADDERIIARCNGFSPPVVCVLKPDGSIYQDGTGTVLRAPIKD